MKNFSLLWYPRRYRNTLKHCNHVTWALESWRVLHVILKTPHTVATALNISLRQLHFDSASSRAACNEAAAPSTPVGLSVYLPVPLAAGVAACGSEHQASHSADSHACLPVGWGRELNEWAMQEGYHWHGPLQPGAELVWCLLLARQNRVLKQRA